MCFKVYSFVHVLHKLAKDLLFVEICCCLLDLSMFCFIVFVKKIKKIDDFLRRSKHT